MISKRLHKFVVHRAPRCAICTYIAHSTLQYFLHVDSSILQASTYWSALRLVWEGAAAVENTSPLQGFIHSLAFLILFSSY